MTDRSEDGAQMGASPWLAPLIRKHRSLHSRDGVLDALPEAMEAGSSAPFEGLYGIGYSAMIRSRRLRRAFFGMWGGAEVLYDLDEVVSAAGRHAAGRPLLDVPSGRGVVAALLGAQGIEARVVGLDLAERAVRAATAEERELPAPVTATYVRGTALDMPFRDEAFSTVVSINGLHVMPDHNGFVAELARVLAPGGRLWLVTAVSSSRWRGTAVLRAGRMLGVLTQRPPTRAQLLQMAAAHGLGVREDLGGHTLVGLVLERTT